jgi:hypothetical protein
LWIRIASIRIRMMHFISIQIRIYPDSNQALKCCWNNYKFLLSINP